MVNFDTPAWVRDAVFYQIFPDRFAKSSLLLKPANLEPWHTPPTRRGFKGGDLLGVLEHLDYIQDLGVTALYLCPIFASVANHRYHTYDYYRVDPLLGGRPALRQLIDAVHRRGMRIILDGVFNHASRGFFQFNHILENGEASPYIDWFHIHSFPLNAYGEEGEGFGYSGWYDRPALPKFNTDTDAAREFLFSVAEYWIGFGADGWRLDAAEQIDHGFWREFRTRIKALNPEAYILGEIWTDASAWLSGDQFDGVTNYQFMRPVHDFCVHGVDGQPATDLGERGQAGLTAPEFGKRIEHLLALYPWSATVSQLNLLASHDTSRLATATNGDIGASRLATLIQMAFPGAPCIYYGDEVGLTSGSDPDSRQTFNWDESTWDARLLDHTKRCIQLRRELPALRHGSFTHVLADDDVYVFARRLADEWALVAINAGHDARMIDFSFPANQGPSELRDPWNSDALHRVRNGWVDGWFVPPRNGAVLIGNSVGLD